MTLSKDNYTRLTRDEWSSIVKATDKAYLEALGPEPSRYDVRQKIDNPHAANALQKTAMLVLFVLAIFTAYKTGALAIPFSNELIDHLSKNTYISEGVRTSFNYVTFILFWLLSTPSLIYFKLLSHDERLVKARLETSNPKNILGYLSLEYISPRLPSMITYFSTIWLVVISYEGSGTIFEKFLPVLAEIGLAQLVGDLIEQSTAYARIVSDRLKIEREGYTYRLKNKEDDERVGILSGIMTERLINLVRKQPVTNKPYKPNAALEQADKELTGDILETEYLRLTTADNFIKKLAPKSHSHNNTVVSAEAVETVENEPVARDSAVRYSPPNGGSEWTHNTLLHQLRVIGASPKSFDEIELAKVFAPNYNARGVWRKSVKEAFTGIPNKPKGKAK